MTPRQLKNIRSKMGMTQEQFSSATGYSVESITKMENARMPISSRAQILFRNAMEKYWLENERKTKNT